MADDPRACPSCGEPFTRTTTEPLIWCAGVATSHAYHHEGRVCVVPGCWVTNGEVPAATAAAKALAGDVYTRKLYQFAVAEQHEEDPRCRDLVQRTWIGAVDQARALELAQAGHRDVAEDEDGRLLPIPGDCRTLGFVKLIRLIPRWGDPASPTASAGSHLPPEKVLLQTRIGGSET